MADKVTLTFECRIEEAELMLAYFDLLARRKAGGDRLSPGTVQAFPAIVEELGRVGQKAAQDALAVGVDYTSGKYPLVDGLISMYRAKQSGATFTINISGR